MFFNEAGFESTKLAMVMALIALTTFWQRRTVWFWLLTLPPIVLLAASTFRLYPIVPRLLLFSAPVFILLVAAGIAEIRTKAISYRQIVAAGLALIFAWPMARATVTAAAESPPFAREELKPVLEHLRERAMPADRVFVYYGAADAYRWYAPSYGLEARPTLIGRSPRLDWRFYFADAAKLEGCGRTWLVFSHIWYAAGADEERFTLFLADTIGRQLDAVHAPGAAAYLYDFDGRVKPGPLQLMQGMDDVLPQPPPETTPLELPGALSKWSCSPAVGHVPHSQRSSDAH